LTGTMTGIDDRTADLQRGLQDTLGRIKVVAEASKNSLLRARVVHHP